MNRLEKLNDYQALRELLMKFNELKFSLDEKFKNELNRSLPFADTLFDRWDYFFVP